MPSLFPPCRVVMICFLLSCVFSAAAQTTSSIPLNTSVSQWTEFDHAARNEKGQTGDFPQKAEGNLKIIELIQLAESYQAKGLFVESISALDQALLLTEKMSLPQLSIVAYNNLGFAYTTLEKYDKAKKLLLQSEQKARIIQDKGLLAAILNNRGILQTQLGNYSQALIFFDQSSQLAVSENLRKLAAKASVNAALTAFKTNKSNKIKYRLLFAKKQLEKVRDSLEKALHWIALGNLAMHLSRSSSAWQGYAYHAFEQAISLGEQLSNPSILSLATAKMGQLYDDGNRLDEALQLTYQAVLALENNNAPDLLFRWQWQAGKILKSKGDKLAAIQAYQQAINTLNPIRQNILSRQSKNPYFKKKINSLYLEMTDLLLQTSSQETDQIKIQHYFMLARNIMEQLKAAELQDYFKDECVTEFEQKIRPLDNIDNNTVAIYPILLPDRIEILLSYVGQLKRFTSSVKRTDVIRIVKQFRHNLENRTTREYLLQAQQLYHWLISPLQDELEKRKIDTLVIMPDESLRTIPLAALHDGNNFLIEKYAIANTPGLNLIAPNSLDRKKIQILAVGLTKSVQGFSALPYVASELENIQKIFGGTRLQDKKFLLGNVENQLKHHTYNIVHIASHGQFNSKANENFVLTFDNKINFNELEQLIGMSKYQKNPIELLTLSACQTAAGDDRAALGLAGIAIKAGARSAVASLWIINDQATSDLISEFYRQLKLPGISKALALKNAQVQMIKKTQYNHPFYWSPFLLIGNWL